MQRTAGNAAVAAAVQRAPRSGNKSFEELSAEFDKTMAEFDRVNTKFARAVDDMQLSVERATVGNRVQIDGETDEVKLTDEVFYARHPKLEGKKLDPKNPRDRSFMKEWERIRVYVVRHQINFINNLGKEGGATSS